MRLLAIDCATEACSVALFEDGGLVSSRHEVLGRGHAEKLVPMIADLPDRGRAEAIRVSLGPGSFTGTRIGLATARALGIAWKAEVLGYPTLALIAAIARESSSKTGILASMAGGHGEFFVQPFDAEGLALEDHRSLAPEAAAKLYDCEVVAGNRAEALVEQRGFGTAIDLLPDARFAHRLPVSLLTDDLRPIYGRAPDARLPG
ncbi:tRNA (adenosine(37)-N6)-threonylcarbamoyltransferase complex dimerization subunit type 1 TsaB [Qipengyuania spongiae]|uniref:tRNA (Adenosine(37)-N6)-threonylcarbamoyltransferase complex dimerization subunit type 1 TsaB n=1 Tax=Qipengyuania spongiae TaxID=2909673 RepID=A0ABY5SW69_9SPHN|nr:tRNA (adenosine(37)-N6)-threonylcarbamoyltransferase complex dimerization subunit type 1 TsaB [Qipengyuania spongiae]UVI38126.1 tRNA (adenosine(37)-N6)-threonylcarbamoyltransferase complex dimerization subunit type 1 TsaB [Qipengyuania spongiae]